MDQGQIDRVVISRNDGTMMAYLDMRDRNRELEKTIEDLWYYVMPFVIMTGRGREWHERLKEMNINVGYV